ncbi:ferritin-like domain-containing protein [Clostridium sp. SHJSY1]|uniref:ferritin-like domain-containing protein n=1 Tax=Clostridium sp. SHJSY1 TaxID=2942483 RepID=UPI002876B298|nr:ferritin-like domain-containing protein [Clostridium sp. SHJSY1]MDS0525979.1 ferritin-like domain-containing protein [Clostridium sp. SHJSY1]
MSYTTMRQPQGVPVFQTNLIREAMIGEIVAINDYNKHIADSNIGEINEIWEHIMKEEKKHYNMFFEVLRRYDHVQLHKFKETKEHMQIKGERYHDLYCPKYSNELILNNLRNDIKGELEAVILYENNLMQISSSDVRKVFNEIIADEKEHAEELTIVLNKYDSHGYGTIEME